MLSLGYTELLATSFVLLIGVAFWPPKTRAFPRRGLEPGFLNLKVWQARIFFFFRGHTVVETAYWEVMYRMPM
jgi:hypothetical protein